MSSITCMISKSFYPINHFHIPMFNQNKAGMVAQILNDIYASLLALMPKYNTVLSLTHSQLVHFIPNKVACRTFTMSMCAPVPISLPILVYLNAMDPKLIFTVLASNRSTMLISNIFHAFCNICLCWFHTFYIHICISVFVLFVCVVSVVQLQC